VSLITNISLVNRLDLPFTLYDNFEYTGIWFLPESRQNYVSGTLKYSKGRFELETIGSITSGDADFISGMVQGIEPPNEIAIILGIATNGIRITLTRCHKSGSKPTMNGLTTYRYTGHDVYLGQNFDTEENIQFDTIEISYSNLAEWYPISGISIDPLSIQDHKLKINYSPVDNVKAKINNDFTLELKIKSKFSKNNVNKECSINESTLLAIKSITPKHYREFHKLSRCYEYFLMLAMAQRVHPISITGSTKDYKVTIFPAIMLHEDIPTIPSHHMLFLYHEIADNFESFIQSWKKLWDCYEEVMTTYFATLFNRGILTIEIQFLRVAFVLEAYHRRRFPNAEVPLDEEYERMIEAMKTKLSDNQQALEFIERNRNKPINIIFKRRLEKLTDICPDVFEDPEEKPQFSIKVAKTRNFFTHISEEATENVVTDPMKMIYLTHEMMALIEGCFLTELPFSESKLKELIIKNRNIKNYAKKHPIK
jgi:hypothetical protein